MGSLSQTLNSSIIQVYPYLHPKNLKMFNHMITMKVCFRFLLTAIVVIAIEQCRSEFVLVEIDDSDRTIQKMDFEVPTRTFWFHDCCTICPFCKCCWE